MSYEHYPRYETRGEHGGHPFHGNQFGHGGAATQSSGGSIKVSDVTTKELPARTFDSETNGKPNAHFEVSHNGEVIGHVYQATINMDRNIAGTRLRSPKPPAQKWKARRTGAKSRESIDSFASKKAAVEGLVRMINQGY